MPTPDASLDRRLTAALERSRQLGFLGPGPIEAHLTNAAAFAAAVDGNPGHALDLGSGGGVPGLVLACWWPSTRWLLLDAMKRRCAFLRDAAGELGIADQTIVVEDRAEAAGRDPGLRGRIDLVTARAFGRPAITAECAAPLLVEGGVLLVSEPPDGGERWDADGLTTLGLQDDGLRTGAGAHIRVLRKVGATDARYPRRTGVPAKRPLW